MAAAAQECDSALEALGASLMECKGVLTKNVHAQLQSISVLQSRIRDLRCKLTAFKEVRVLSRPNDISYATGSYKPSAERIDQ